MRHTLDHLPADKQEQLRAMVSIIREAAEVEMIILFGSYARGSYVEDPIGGYFSDVDMCVVVQSRRLASRDDIWSTVEQRARRLTGEAAVSLIVHDIEDVNWQLEQGWYFFSDIKKEGIMLYDSGRFALAEAKEQPLERRRAYAQECFDRYFEKANRLYATFEFHLEKDWHNEAAFELHQATETYYKGAILVFTAYRPKEHNIAELGKRCADLHPAFRGIFPQDTLEERRLFKLLKAAYVDARYSMRYRITREELEFLARHVRELRTRMERACREHIASMTPASDAE